MKKIDDDIEFCEEYSKCNADKIPFLGSMPEEHKNYLLENSLHKRQRKGSYLFREGDAVDAIYIIIKGKVKLARYDSDGREQIIGIFSQGDTIWEGMLI